MQRVNYIEESDEEESEEDEEQLVLRGMAVNPSTCKERCAENISKPSLILVPQSLYLQNATY